MSTLPTPTPTKAELRTAFKKNKDIRKCLNEIMDLFIESYKKGHSGTDKMIAYTRTNQVVALLDTYMIEVFNRLTYGKR